MQPTPQELLAFVERADMESRMADADRPHVLVAVLAGGPGHGKVGAVTGPFSDLTSALLYAPDWDASLNQPGESYVGVMIDALPLYPPDQDGG